MGVDWCAVQGGAVEVWLGQDLLAMGFVLGNDA